MAKPVPASAIAQLLQLSERRIYQLVRDGLLPKASKGMYDPVACVHAYIDYLKKLITGDGELSLTDERTRLTKYQADLAQMEIKKVQGELIESKRARHIWGEVILSTRQRLLGLKTRLAPLVAGIESIAEVESIIERATHEILNELSNPELKPDEGGQSDPPMLEGLQAPAKTKGKRVGGRKKKVKLGSVGRAGPMENSEGGIST